MTRLILFFSAILLAVAPEAQPLLVESATPANYASGVSQTAQVAFTFSEPLVDITQGFGAFPTLVTLPTGGVEITATDQSADGRTVTFSVSLQENQRYVFLMLDAMSESGRLARPFALNFTTASSGGSFRVSGTVEDASAQSLDGALVALVTGDLESGDVEIVAVDVIESDQSSAAYTVGPVPLSLYTAGAIRLPFPLASSEGLAYGLYDPDGDGTPNPILSTSGIDVAIAPPDPFTAREGIQDAEVTASGAIEAPRFIGVAAAGVGTDGRAGAWRYSFESETTFDKTDVLQVGLFSLPIANDNDVVGFPALPDVFMDSDAALAAAEASGGAAFRAANQLRLVSVAMQAMSDPLSAADPEWEVRYSAREPGSNEESDALELLVPFRSSTSTGVSPASGVAVRLRSSNPTRTSVSLILSSAQPTDALVDVLDARGRRVAVLYTGTLSSGETRLDAELPRSIASGVYTVRAATPEAIRSIRLVVAR